MSSSSDGHYKVYEQHMNTLRAWFVAYGVGGPVLFVTQKDFAASLIQSGESKLVGILFLVGVLLQSLVALLNKWVNWGLYYFEDDGEEDEPAAKSKLQEFCEDISSKVWIDILADVATLVLFSVATVIVLSSVAAGAT